MRIATLASDLYRTLGVPPAALPDEIRPACRPLVCRHHPDTDAESAGLGAVVAAYRELGRRGLLAPPAHPGGVLIDVYA